MFQGGIVFNTIEETEGKKKFIAYWKINKRREDLKRCFLETIFE